MEPGTNATQKEERVVLKINFKHDTKMNFPNEATVLDLKTQISKNFLIREDEYELFLGENSLSKVPNKTSLESLVEQYKTSNFSIKSYKNIFDLKKQLVDYNEFLDRNIKFRINRTRPVRLIKYHKHRIIHSIKRSRLGRLARSISNSKIGRAFKGGGKPPAWSEGIFH